MVVLKTLGTLKKTLIMIYVVKFGLKKYLL